MRAEGTGKEKSFKIISVKFVRQIRPSWRGGVLICVRSVKMYADSHKTSGLRAEEFCLLPMRVYKLPAASQNFPLIILGVLYGIIGFEQHAVCVLSKIKRQYLTTVSRYQNTLARRHHGTKFRSVRKQTTYITGTVNETAI